MPTKKKKTPSIKKSKISLPRAPVVAILGHVDHGKTSLLDSIKKTNLQANETGGITQHIGAYQVNHNHQSITFIDTPGHSAFAKMRQRGAQVTDLVILVIAANDGVKPQTKESIRHIKAANVPFIVAINKMDMPGATPDMVKSQLVEEGVNVEGFGGDVVAVETIATKNKGITELLDMILLVSEVNGLKGKSTDPLKAVVIESSMQKNRGPVATLIVKQGTLNLKDQLQTASQTCTAKAFFDENNKSKTSVKPGEPAVILGFKQLPVVGEIITRIGESKPEPAPPKPLLPVKKPEKPEKPEEEEEERPRIKAILKADAQGTLEAIKNSVAEEVEKIGEGIGDVTESDVLLAAATGAKILSFRVKIPSSVKKIAAAENVEIITYQAIYDLLEDLEKQVLKILEPTIDEEIIGIAKIAQNFDIKKTRVAGCKVTQGKIESGGTIHLVRKDKIIGSSTISSLKQGKKDISVAKKDEECGLIFKPSLDFKVGDQVQYYRTVSESK